MKKFMKVVATSMLALALASCGGGETTSETTGNTTTTDATGTETETGIETETETESGDRVVEGDLLVWLDNDDWADAVIEAFEAKYPGVSVENNKVESVDTRGKVELDGPAGIGPDVFIFPHDGASLAIADGLVEPLPEDLQETLRNTVLQPALDTVTVDGEIYAVPISTENIALFWNKDIYGEEAPETFEEIIEFAKEYNDPAANKYALKWQVDDSYHNYPFLTAGGMQLFGEDHLDYTQPGFDSEEAAKGSEYHNSLREIFDVNTTDATYETTVAAFQNGDAVFTISGPWAIADARNNGINFGVAKLPTIDGNQPVAFSGNIIANVSSYANNYDAAVAFVEFLASPEGAEIMYKTTGKMPALVDAEAVPGVSDNEYLMGMFEQAPFTHPMPVIPEMSQAWDPMKVLFTFTWDGALSTEEAQEKAMSDYETLLQAAGKSLN